MLRRPWLPAALLAPILLLAYGGGLGRGFTSEDFLILRRLGSGGFLERAAESFAGPWLGASFVPFYRPFSSLLLQLELLFFGADPLPYLLLQLLVHGASALLLGAWLKLLLPGARESEVFLATLIFALYPLHPNSVLFVATFATLFATFFLFAALYLEAAGRRPAALAAAALALLSYEQAVLLPFLILVFDLAAKGNGQPGRWRSWPRLFWPYWALAAVYLLTRSALLGDLGGYQGFRERLLDPAALLASLAELTGRLFVPIFALPSGGALTLATLAFLALVAATAIRRREDPGARVLLAALAAIPAVQAPFFFTGVVPGNGRYFYLASALVAIVLWQSLRLLPRRAEKLAAPVLAGLALLAGWALQPVVEVYAAAARRCEEIRTALEKAPPGRLFVAGRPAFLEKWSVPVAQVFHWGLADALSPPFTRREDLDVYPLPELSDAELAPLLRAAELGRVVRLAADDELVFPAAPEPLPALLEAAAESGRPALLLEEAPPGSTLRLIVLAPGGPSVLPLAAAERGWRGEIPPATFEGMKLLYARKPILVFIEARDEKGVVAASDVFAF